MRCVACGRPVNLCIQLATVHRKRRNQLWTARLICFFVLIMSFVFHSKASRGQKRLTDGVVL